MPNKAFIKPKNTNRTFSILNRLFSPLIIVFAITLCFLPYHTGQAQTTSPTLPTSPATNDNNNVPNVDIDIFPNLNISAPNIHHIPYFQSEITIKKNRQISVTDTIVLVVPAENAGGSFKYVLNKQIKTPFGLKRITPRVMNTTHNNTYSSFKLIPHQDYDEIILNSSADILNEGNHIITINYRVDDAIETTSNTEAVILNILGLQRLLPITRTVIMINHEEGLTPSGQELLLNGQASNEIQNFSQDKNNYSFLKKGVITPESELILIETFPEGAFSSRNIFKIIADTFSDNIAFLSYILGLGFIIIYYVISLFWPKHEKRTLPNPLLEDKHLKHFFSAAGLRMFLKQTLDEQTILSLLLSATTKGAIKISKNDDGRIILLRQAISTKDAHLSNSETLFVKTLFPSGVPQIFLDETTGVNISKTRKKLEYILKQEYNSVFFHTNYIYFAFGILIMAGAIAGGTVLNVPSVLNAAIALALGFGTLLSVIILCFIIKQIKSPTASVSKKITITILLTLLFAGLLTGTTIAFLQTNIKEGLFATIAIISMPIFILLFYILAKSTARLGRYISDLCRITTDYLSSTLPLPDMIANNASKASQVFGKQFPFALATDNEKTFINRFATTLENHNQICEFCPSKSVFSASSIIVFIEDLSHKIQTICPFIKNKIQRFK